jgi:hypothetical protein
VLRAGWRAKTPVDDLTVVVAVLGAGVDCTFLAGALVRDGALVRTGA